MKALVLRSTGSWYTLLTENGETIQGRLRGKFKTQGLRHTNPIAVGDNVMFEWDDQEGYITEIMPRTNALVRKSVKKKSETHIMAANIDYSIVVASPFQPRTPFGFIDRFLVCNELYKIPSVLVFNKIDLLEPDQLTQLQGIVDYYTSIGYPTMLTSTVTNQGIEEFSNFIRNKVVFIGGHSGVGKSSLINKIAPELDLRTSEISTQNEKGTHTTTYAEMHRIQDGKTMIIDSPGIKEFGLVDLEKHEVSHYFPEMLPLLGSCKFYNCTHLHEPGCAVMTAVENDQILASRYQSYLGIVEGDDRIKVY